MEKKKMCVLDEEVECDNCGECLRCDLDPGKICDNCMKCVNSEGAEFRAIRITGVVLDDDK
ncbi:MAG: hypothetical protein II920_09065 [Clostridia bacterium]|nr:hypothetical protein [Clostridia bacterium]